MSEVLLAGHLPPPVHGLSVAVQAFAQLLDERGRLAGHQVVIERISAPTGLRRGAHHLHRLVRVAKACRTTLRRRRTLTFAYVSVDAGYGQFYTCLLAAAARIGRVPLVLHHHSVAYIDGGRFRTQVLVRVAAPHTTHLVGCECMAQRLGRGSPRLGADVRVLPIWYAVSGAPASTAGPCDGGLRIGHLSNLSTQKGLAELFELRRALEAAGVDATLVIAGPVLDDGDRRLLTDELAKTERTRWLGPVYGADRDRFFESIDVFAFPSRYEHESFGLVVAEALVRGLPVVTYETGCIDAEDIGSAGLVIPLDQPFTEVASAWLADLGAAAPSAADVRNDIAARFGARCEEARTTARSLVDELLGGVDR